MDVAGVLCEGGGQIAGVILKRRLGHVAVSIKRRPEGVRAERVGVVVEGAAADVRNVGADRDGVAAARPRHHIADAEIVLGAQKVALRRSTEEIDDDAHVRCLGDVGVAVEVLLAHDGELVQHNRRKRRVEVSHGVVILALARARWAGRGRWDCQKSERHWHR